MPNLRRANVLFKGQRAGALEETARTTRSAGRISWPWPTTWASPRRHRSLSWSDSAPRWPLSRMTFPIPTCQRLTKPTCSQSSETAGPESTGRELIGHGRGRGFAAASSCGFRVTPGFRNLVSGGFSRFLQRRATELGYEPAGAPEFDAACRLTRRLCSRTP